MKPEILNDIPFEIDLADLLQRLHVDESNDDAEVVRRLAAAARSAGRPKAMYKIAYVEDRGENSIVLDRVTFTSRVLRVNLDQVHRVFAYVATCGMELETWSRSIEDVFQRYWADAIKATALGSALRALDRHVAENHRPGQTSTMNPGSLEDWPLPQQRPLFELLGGPREAVGVELTDSFLMVPNKSVSGIRFATEVRFESCQLCPRPKCSGRRAAYEKDLYARKYSPRS